MPDDRTLLLLRFAGEMATKSARVRTRFQQRLLRNVKDALAHEGIEHAARPAWTRLFVEAADPRAPEVLARVFGVRSLSPIDARLPADLDAIVQAGTSLFAERVRGRRFAVRARRAGAHPFRSHDVEVRLGAALLPHAAGVDLTHPEVTVFVEVRDDEAYLFHEQVPGAGGLPLGSQHGALALLSGGFDSAVAAWYVLKRGVPLDYLFCNVAGAAYERAVVQVAKSVADRWSYGDRPALHILDFGPLVDALRERVRPNYVQVVLKRCMYRAASRLAAELGRKAIVTGESIGQVSSQTLANLRAIDDAADLPVLRPVAGLDKEEIIEGSRRIGTYALSSKVQEYCALVPDRPVTAARPEAAQEEERKLPADWLDATLDGRRSLDLRALEPSDLVLPYVYARDVPDGAVVLDGRPLAEFEAWHYPGARRIDLDDLLGHYARLDKDPVYLLVCPLGLQSGVVAERMQRAGYRAYSFQGGARRLRALTAETASHT
jgi:thiamine biosynthesis protein ThiI